MKKVNNIRNTIIFFDRDGVLVPSVEIDDKPSPTFKIGDKIDASLIEKIKSLRKFAYLFMVTNQPDIARGKKNLKTLIEENEFIKKELYLDDWSMCVHDDKDNCKCRKPKIGLFQELLNKWNLNKNFFFLYMIGDRMSDMLAGENFGCKNLFINYKYKETNYYNHDYESFSGTIEAIDSIKNNYIQ